MKKYKVTVNGTAYEIELEEIDAAAAKQAQPAASAAVPAPQKPAASAADSQGETVSAPMPGNILDVKVSVGSSVKKGDVLLILEAMKMENEIMAPVDGTVKALNVSKGSTVETGTVLCVIG